MQHKIVKNHVLPHSEPGGECTLIRVSVATINFDPLTGLRKVNESFTQECDSCRMHAASLLSSQPGNIWVLLTAVVVWPLGDIDLLLLQECQQFCFAFVYECLPHVILFRLLGVTFLYSYCFSLLKSSFASHRAPLCHSFFYCSKRDIM